MGRNQSTRQLVRQVLRETHDGAGRRISLNASQIANFIINQADAEDSEIILDALVKSFSAGETDSPEVAEVRGHLEKALSAWLRRSGN